MSTIIVGDQEDLNGGDDDIEELEAGGQDHLGGGQIKKGPKIPLDHACKAGIPTTKVIKEIEKDFILSEDLNSTRSF